ncbi:MAG: hypothetical protein HIU81_08830 [Acidobacteria bacterium]|nr:hypothetical protein [Acidobacteriota bacterium]
MAGSQITVVGTGAAGVLAMVDITHRLSNGKPRSAITGTIDLRYVNPPRQVAPASGLSEAS